MTYHKQVHRRVDNGTLDTYTWTCHLNSTSIFHGRDTHSLHITAHFLSMQRKLNFYSVLFLQIPSIKEYDSFFSVDLSKWKNVKLDDKLILLTTLSLLEYTDGDLLAARGLLQLADILVHDVVRAADRNSLVHILIGHAYTVAQAGGLTSGSIDLAVTTELTWHGELRTGIYNIRVKFN